MTDCDLKYQSDDLVISDNDLVLAYDIDVLMQDLYNQIRIPYYAWALNFLFGSKIPEYVNVPDEPLKMVELKQDVIEILRREPRVVKDSWQIKIQSSQITVQFLPTGRDEPITLILKTQ
jgi:hypothetical protein